MTVCIIYNKICVYVYVFDLLQQTEEIVRLLWMFKAEYLFKRSLTMKMDLKRIILIQG